MRLPYVGKAYTAPHLPTRSNFDADAGSLRPKRTAGHEAGLRPEERPMMTAYYLGNLCAALVTVGLLIGTLRFTRRLSE